jgi:predicted DCC family thiol-disulfide oxidoreductase YuxK
VDTNTWLEQLEDRVDDRLSDERGPLALTVLFDPTCSLCQRCRTWMLAQASYVPLTFLACSSDEARRWFGDIPWLADELVVVGDGGQVWAGPAAFLTCLWQHSIRGRYPAVFHCGSCTAVAPGRSFAKSRCV